MDNFSFENMKASASNSLWFYGIGTGIMTLFSVAQDKPLSFIAPENISKVPLKTVAIYATKTGIISGINSGIANVIHKVNLLIFKWASGSWWGSIYTYALEPHLLASTVSGLARAPQAYSSLLIFRVAQNAISGLINYLS